MTMVETAWETERRRWSLAYRERLATQMQQVTAVVLERRAEPQTLQNHFESCLSLLTTAEAQADLAPLWLELVAGLHPLPIRWGRWSAWLDIVRKAAAVAAEAGQTSLQSEYLSHVATILNDTGQFEDALRIARTALAHARTAGDAEALAAAGVSVTAALRNLGRFEEALTVLEQVEADVAAVPGEPTTRRAWSQCQLSLERMDLDRHFGRLPEAVALGGRALSALEDSPGIDGHDLAAAYRRRATILWAASHYGEAADDLVRSASLFRAAGDELQAVFSEGNLGLVYFSMGRFDEALVIKLRAIRAAEELDAGWWLVRDLGELCGLYMYRGQLEEALPFCHRHVELARQYSDAAQLAMAHANRGMTLVLLDRAGEAGSDLEAALRYFEEQGRVEGIIGSTIDLIQYLHQIGSTSEATARATEIYARAGTLGYPVLRLLATRCLALLAAPEAKSALLREALALARAHRRPLDIAGCLFDLSTLAIDPLEQRRLYEEGVALLQSIGAVAWLAGRSAEKPPFMPLFL